MSANRYPIISNSEIIFGLSQKEVSFHTNNVLSKETLYPIAFSGKSEEAVRRKADELYKWLKESGKDERLCDISFTLMCGRSHFRYRCILLAGNMDELVDALECLKSGTLRIVNPVFGEEKKQKIIQAESLLKMLVEQHRNGAESGFDELSELCSLYCAGCNINWKEFFAGNAVRRVSMPAYPFDMECGEAPQTSSKYAMLAQIVDQRVNEYTVVLSRKEPYLSDHVVHGINVLPGAAQLELAIEGAENLSKGKRVTRVYDVEWMNIIALDQDSDEIRVTIRFTYVGDDMQYEIVSQKDGVQVLHGKGCLSFALQVYQPFLTIHDFPNTFAVTGNQYRMEMAKNGLKLGKSFQSVIQLGFNEDKAVAKLQLPEKLESSLNDYCVSPFLLDGAWNAVSGIVYYGEKCDNECTALPNHLDELVILGSMEKKITAYAVETTVSSDSKSRTFDIYILNSDCKVLMVTKGFSLPKKRLIDRSMLWYRPQWMNLSLERGMFPSTILYADEDKTYLHAFRDQCKDIAVIPIEASKSYTMLADGSLAFDMKSDLQWEQVLNKASQDDGNICVIINLDVSDKIENEVYSRKCFDTVFAALKAMSRLPRIKIRFVCFFKSETATADIAAVSSLMKTAMLEATNIKAKCVQLTEKATIAQLVDELSDNLSWSDVRLSDSLRECLVYTPIEPPISSYKMHGGVFLLSGGAGKIGLKIATNLVSIPNSHVVIMGRRPKAPEGVDAVRQVAANGSTVEYLSVNVAQYTEVRNAVESVIRNYGALTGVIHAAGVQRDALMDNKKEDDIEATLDAKIAGAINLDRATMDTTLEFMVFFSSVSAVGGCIGQADYSYANGYLDAFCRWREGMRLCGKRSGITYSIDWSLWKDGGMTVDSQTEQFYLDKYGVLPIDDTDGLRAFMQVLGSEGGEYACFYGNQTKIESEICIQPQVNMKSQPPVSSISSESQKAKVDLQLKQTLANVCGCDIKSIYFGGRFDDYGFDSLMLASLARELNRSLKLQLTPATFYNFETIREFANYLYENITFIDETELQPQPLALPTITQTVETSDVKNVSCEETIMNASQEPIAIIGMSCVMPQSDDKNEFWNNLIEGKDLITEIPPERWDYKAFNSHDGTDDNTTVSKWGGFMREVDKFDCKFFGISPKEAELMDPQQRLFIQTIWHTIDDAGYSPKDFSGTQTGVFVGVSTHDYYDLLRDSGMPIDARMATGSSHCILANRISYLLNITGPSEPIDTACSSSLVAIHHAVESMRNGQCEMAFVGGVNLLLTPTLQISFEKSGMLSKTGRCKSFDQSADGYTRGEGVGAVLLKPLSKAKRDGDHIYALVRSTAVNHNGHAKTLTSPNAKAQAELIFSAYSKAGIKPGQIGYIEAHGTGTPLGDPIEIEGLKSAFSMLYKYYDEKFDGIPYCYVGAVKANIGHLETAAGIAGVLKTVMAINHHKLPANPNLKQINSYIQTDNSPFVILDKGKEWEAIKDRNGNPLPRIAGVSSFGFGGVNAHIVLEEYHDSTTKTENISSKKQAYLFSAKTINQLKRRAASVADWLENDFNNCNVKAEYDVDRVKQLVSEILKVSPEEMNEYDTLNELGFDYAAITKLKAKMNADTLTVDLTDTLESIAKRCIIEQNTEDSTRIELLLQRLSFTLCSCQSYYDERLAIIVSNVQELIDGLRAFVDGQSRSNVYNGTCSDEKETEKVDSDNPEEICRGFIEGSKICYNGADGELIRCQLPPYPFEKRRCWYTDDTVSLKSKKTNQIQLAIDWDAMASASDGSKVSLEITDDNIAIVRMIDREHKNMFTNELLGGLLKRFQEIKQHGNIKVIIITGYDNIFSMGGTYEQLIGIADAKNNFTDIPFLYRGLLDADVPVISVMQGHAYGGGMLFGMYGDIVMMAEEGVYSAVFMKYGFTPGMGATGVLADKLGGSLASELMYSASLYDGRTLKENGAQVRIMPREQLMPTAMKLARNIAKKPRNSLKVLKSELSSRYLSKLEPILEAETEMHKKTFLTAEVRENIERIYNGTMAKKATTNREQKACDGELLDSLLDSVSRGVLSPEEAAKIHSRLMETAFND